jgi:site-specific DNA-methyltransferase (adenine-specific)
VKPYYECDGITIYHGDCREVMPELTPESVTLLWTDPPYGHNNHVGDWNARLNAHRGLPDQPIHGDGPESAREALNGMLWAATGILRADCCCCCCCGGGGGPAPTFAWVADRMDRNGLSFFHAVVWNKLNPGLGWRFRRQYEMVMVAHRTGGRLAWANDEIAVPNLQELGPPRDREHPNEKPLDLPARFIAWTTRPKDLILDPFMGSGTTLRAAKDLGRRAIGIELEERYCEIAARRLDQGVLELNG